MKFSLEYTPTGASAPTPAPASAAPSTPSALEVSFDVNLEELADLVDLVDEEAVAALTNHLSDLADKATMAPPPAGSPGQSRPTCPRETRFGRVGKFSGF